MIQRKCPKCKDLCDLSEEQVSLGMVTCNKCGAKFEVFPNFPEKTSAKPQIPKNPEKDPPTQRTEASAAPEKSTSDIANGGMVGKGKIDWRYLRPFIFIIISVGVVYGLWLLNWTTVLLLISLLATFSCWLAKRGEKRSHGVKTIRYFFLDKSLEFFAPLTLVVIFYTILSWYIGWNNTDQSTIASLEQLQQQLDSLQYYLSWLKFKPWIAALIILAIILLDLFLSIFFSFKDLGAYYKYYSLWSKRIFTIVFLLCCFTFLGEISGEKRADLSARIDKISEGYSKVREKASQMLTDAVQEKLYAKVRMSFPAEVRPEAYINSIDGKLEKLRVSVKYAEAAKVNVTGSTSIIDRYEKFNDEPIQYSEAKSPASSQPPSNKPPASESVESIEKIVSEIETKPTFKQKLASLIESKGGKQLFCQFPKSFTGAIKSAAFEALIKKYPLIEPIVDVFIGTFDKTVEEKINSSAEKVAESIMKDGANVNNVVTEEAQKIVSSTQVKTSSEPLSRIREAFVNITTKFNEIDVAADNQDKQTRDAIKVESEKAEGLGSSIMGGHYTCVCGSRVIWGPIYLSGVQAHALCPPVPCKP